MNNKKCPLCQRQFQNNDKLIKMGEIIAHEECTDILCHKAFDNIVHWCLKERVIIAKTEAERQILTFMAQTTEENNNVCFVDGIWKNDEFVLDIME